MSLSYLGHLGLKQEVSFGTEATPPEVFGQFYSESVTMDGKLIRPMTVNGSRFVKEALPGAVMG
jgi:hypothetical protein